MNPDHITFRVSYDDPWRPYRPKQTWFTISRATFNAAFSRRPSTREIPFDVQAQAIDAEVLTARRRLASIITNELTSAIMTQLAKHDTVNGYEPEEIDESNA
jgi:hypothetical protein